MSVLNIQAVSEDSILPTFSNEKGYTLYANEDKTIRAGTIECIKSGFKMAIPQQYCAIIYSPGSLKLLGGLIDSDYRGEISCIAYSSCDYEIKRGDPVGAMFVLEISMPHIEDVTTSLSREHYKADGVECVEGN